MDIEIIFVISEYHCHWILPRTVPVDLLFEPITAVAINLGSFVHPCDISNFILLLFFEYFTLTLCSDIEFFNCHVNTARYTLDGIDILNFIESEIPGMQVVLAIIFCFTKVSAEGFSTDGVVI